MSPTHIAVICPHCGAPLVPRRATVPNADDDEWACGAHCTDALYFDWSAQQMAEVLGPSFPPWPTRGATLAELQAEVRAATGATAPRPQEDASVMPEPAWWWDLITRPVAAWVAVRDYVRARFA